MKRMTERERYVEGSGKRRSRRDEIQVGGDGKTVYGGSAQGARISRVLDLSVAAPTVLLLGSSGGGGDGRS